MDYLIVEKNGTRYRLTASIPRRRANRISQALQHLATADPRFQVVSKSQILCEIIEEAARSRGWTPTYE